jgi:S-phase kinase-associated protein 1
MTKPITLLSLEDNFKIQSDTISLSGSELLKGIIEEYQDQTLIQIPDIKGEILESIVFFLEHHKNTIYKPIPNPLPRYELKEFISEWDYNYINKYEQNINELFELIKAANYFDIRHLLDLACAKAATIIKDYDQNKFIEVLQIEQDMNEEDLKRIELEFEKQREEGKNNLVKMENEMLNNYENNLKHDIQHN